MRSASCGVSSLTDRRINAPSGIGTVLQCFTGSVKRSNHFRCLRLKHGAFDQVYFAELLHGKGEPLASAWREFRFARKIHRCVLQ